MGLLLASAIAATIVPAAQVDLSSPTTYVSNPARAAIADGSVANLACVDLPKRSRKYRIACVTSAEWQKAAQWAVFDARRNRGPAYEQFFYQPVPPQASPYQSTWGQR